MRGARRSVLSLALAVLIAVGLMSAPALASGSPGAGPYAVPAAGTFYPTDVHRLFGSALGGAVVTPGRDATVPVVGRADLPTSGISAAVVNVTVTTSTSAAALSAFASRGPVPANPLLSLAPATTRSVLLTIALGPAGAMDLRAVGGSMTVVVDLVGFYAADDTIVASRGLSGGYQPTEPVRLHDSRTAVSYASIFDRYATPRPRPVPANGRLVLDVDLGGQINPQVTALLLRVSVLAPSAPGSLTVWRDGPPPDLASLSYAPAGDSSNLAVVPTDDVDAEALAVVITNRGSAPVDVTVDLVGFYDNGGLGPNLRYRPLDPTRVVDSQRQLGTPGLVPGGPATLRAPSSVAGDNTVGLVGVLSVSGANGPTGLTIWPHGSTQPQFPALAAGSAAGVAPVQTELGPGNALDLASSAAAADVVLDVTGSFESYPAVANPALKHWVHPLSSWQVSAVVR